MTGLRWGVRTDVGRARSINEDNVYAEPPLFAVADGMGGHAAGEVASRVALDALAAALAGGLDRIVPGDYGSGAGAPGARATNVSTSAEGSAAATRSAGSAAGEGNAQSASAPRPGSTGVSEATGRSARALRPGSTDAGASASLRTPGETHGSADADGVDAPTLEALVAGVRNANRVVFERSESDDELRGMGTTLCALALVRRQGEERLCVVNVGDSRGYVVQDGQLVQITRDHSYVEDLVQAGEITPAQARVHPRRNIVTRALGIEAEVDVDTWEVLPYAGDRYLLCSDGLIDEVEDDAIVAALIREPDPQAAADELVRLANEGGGHDNISVVVVDVVADDHDGAAPAPADGAAGVHAAALPSDATQELPAMAAATARAPRGRRAERRPRARRRTGVRALAYLVLLAGVAAVAVGAITYFGRSGYFVAYAAGDHVAIYKGRPGGLLWLDPTVATTFPLTRGSVPVEQVTRLEQDPTFGERRAAEQYVAFLTQRADEQAAATTTTSTTTTVAPTTLAPTTVEPVTVPPVTVAPPAPGPPAETTAVGVLPTVEPLAPTTP